jgi:hypothetical protein
MTINAIVRSGPGSEGANSDLSRKLNEWLEASGPTGIFRTCGSCRHMTPAGTPATCRRYGVAPPIDVIMRGCDLYSDEAEPPLDADIPY